MLEATNEVSWQHANGALHTPFPAAFNNLRTMTERQAWFQSSEAKDSMKHFRSYPVTLVCDVEGELSSQGNECDVFGGVPEESETDVYGGAVRGGRAEVGGKVQGVGVLNRGRFYGRTPTTG
jgi:hypothetical protein